MEPCIGKIYIALATLALASSALATQVRGITTTIYVGRHFEIRDHDQPTKYVFNGSTRVAEITGSLSSNLRIQRLRLFAGWNLCSLAVSGPFPASGAEAVSAAYQWNSGSGVYSQVTLGQSLAGGTVLWLKAGTNAVVSILGSYAEPVARQLQPGGAYIPDAGLEAWSPVLPDLASSWEFDASTGQWFGQLAGDLAAISGPPPTLAPGQAFYVQAAAPSSLEIPDPTLRIRYYHEDHLGSSSGITDATGALVEETAFHPFGVPRNEYRPRQVEEPYQFTQKERDGESGLHYFETRYLAGGLGRFITPDLKYACPDRLPATELSACLSTPQQLNLYAYVRNSPLRFTDPRGEDGSRPKNPPESPDTQSVGTLTLETGGKEIVIPMTSLNFGENRSVTSDSRNARSDSAEKSQPVFKDLVITKTMDNSSPLLAGYAGEGHPPMTGEIELRRTTAGHSEVYMKYKLTSVIISGYNIESGTSEPVPNEAIRVNAEIVAVFPSEQKTSQSQGAGESRVLRHRYSTPEPPSNRAPSTE